MKGLLINYEYCTGCHACEVSCQMEHGLDDDRFGIVVEQVGPWEISKDKWEYDFVPVPTDQCDLCAERTSKGKDPLCVHHCQALCMAYGDLDELAQQQAEMHGKTVLFVPKSGSKSLPTKA